MRPQSAFRSSALSQQEPHVTGDLSGEQLVTWSNLLRALHPDRHTRFQ
jgi:hypothetical protein